MTWLYPKTEVVSSVNFQQRNRIPNLTVYQVSSSNKIPPQDGAVTEIRSPARMLGAGITGRKNNWLFNPILETCDGMGWSEDTITSSITTADEPRYAPVRNASAFTSFRIHRGQVRRSYEYERVPRATGKL